jgi:hypothetical protein
MHWPVVKSNCLTYVLNKIRKEGGGSIIYKSQFGWWPHFQHVSKTGIITELNPEGPKSKRRIPPLFFYGKINVVGLILKKTTEESLLKELGK